MAMPYLIGALNQFLFAPDAQQCGPFEIGSNLYACLIDGSAVNDYARMMKSADGGQTWAEQDSGNAPQVYNATGDANNIVDVRQVGSDLHVAYIDFTNAISTVKFSADAWGTPDTGGPAIAASAPVHGQILFRMQRSTGYDLFVYNQDAGINPETWGVELNAGVWGAPFQISPTTYAAGGVIDSADRMTIFFRPYFIVTPPLMNDFALKCRTYTSASVLSGADISIIDDSQNGGATMGLPVVATVEGVESVCFGYGRGIIWPTPTWDAFIALQYHAAFVIGAVADAPTFIAEQVNYLNNGEFDWEASTPYCDWTVTVGADERARCAWRMTNKNRFEYFYNNRHAASLWEPLNTLGYSTFGDAASPVRKQIDAIQGRYLPGRAKHGYLVQINGPTDFGIYYIEHA